MCETEEDWISFWLSLKGKLSSAHTLPFIDRENTAHVIFDDLTPAQSMLGSSERIYAGHSVAHRRQRQADVCLQG